MYTAHISVVCVVYHVKYLSWQSELIPIKKLIRSQYPSIFPLSSRIKWTIYQKSVWFVCYTFNNCAAADLLGPSSKFLSTLLPVNVNSTHWAQGSSAPRPGHCKQVQGLFIYIIVIVLKNVVPKFIFDILIIRYQFLIKISYQTDASYFYFRWNMKFEIPHYIIL